MPIKDVQLTNKQHAVPQNIMDVEFKLIGDLTMRQFAYLLVFGGLAYVSAITVGGIFRWPLVLFLALVGVSLAFVPISERGLDEWIVNFFKSIYSPTQRVWRKEPTIPSAFYYENIAVVRQELITLAPTSSRRKLEEFLEYQRSVVKDPLDIPESEYIAKVRQAFAGVAEALPNVAVISAPVTTVAPEQGAAPVGVTILPPIVSEPEKPQTVQPAKEEKPAEKVSRPVETAGPVESLKPKPAQPEAKQPLVQLKPKPQPIEGIERKVKRDVYIASGASVTPAPMTPDMHAGRRFTSFLPSQGELVLPIRGERVLKTTAEVEIEEDIQVKTEKLQALLAQIKNSEDYKRTAAPVQKTEPTPSVSRVAQTTPVGPTIPLMQSQAGQAQPAIEKRISEEAVDLVSRLRQENDRLSAEIEKLKGSTSTQQDTLVRSELLKNLESQKEKTAAEYASLQQQVLELQNRLKEKQVENPFGESTVASSPVYARIQPLTTKPNVISGMVKKPTGEPIEGLVIIIKNSRGEPVRALKTDTVGQFALNTSLLNGVYTVEVGSNNFGLRFDIISVEAKGSTLPPIELVGKV